MLKKLRNSLLLIMMITLSIVIIGAFCMIFFFINLHLRGLDTDRLRQVPPDILTNELIASREESGTDSKTTGNENVFIDPNRDSPLDYGKSFVVNINREGGVLSVFSNVDMKGDVYLNAAKLVRKSGREMGYLRFGGKHWQYLTYEEKHPITGESFESIVYLDVGDTDSAMAVLLAKMLGTAVFVLIIVFLIIRRFANRAIIPVEESMEKQRRFVADASHELKTPLAIIDSNAEAILSNSEESVASQRQWIDRIGEESERMRGLIEDLLYLARSEDQAQDTMPTNLSSIAERAILRTEAVLFERGVSLKFEKLNSEGPIVSADAERLEQAILILLDNAVKYTDADGSVRVVTGQTHSTGFVRVENTGTGISPADLPRVFDRFYRADKARSHTEGSYGLGLSIAKAIIERAGGKIHAASADGLTSFTIDLPICNS